MIDQTSQRGPATERRSLFPLSLSLSRCSRSRTRRPRIPALLAVLVVAFVPALGVAAQTSPPIAPADPLAQTAGETSRYFAETGHNLAEPFLSHWSAAGGEATLGPPQSEERYAEGAGGVLQTFSALTLLYDPSQQAPLDVQGQPLDPEARDSAAPRTALRPVAGCTAGADCRFFAETGHTLSGNLAAFWSTSGDQPIFGLPVSEPFPDETPGANPSVSVQVFANAILEDHGAAGVRLRPLGLDSAKASGLLIDPAFQPAPPTGGTTFLVGPNDGLRLRSGPSMDAPMVTLLAENAEFIAATPADGSWLPGYADGFAGWVNADFLHEAPALPPLALADWNPEVWQGAALGDTNVRAEPTTKARVVQQLTFGDPVTVSAWVKGEEVFQGADIWAQIGEGRYLYGRNIGRNAPVVPLPPPVDAPAFGKWIDVDLTQQLMTAYDGQTPIRTVEITTGVPGWDTPPGHYQILSRVANETMTSGAIGAEHFYKLEDVLFTQYFTDRGHAIHFAWWRTPQTIGRPGSHGCINLLLDDARFFWDWAEIGTPLDIHP